VGAVFLFGEQMNIIGIIGFGLTIAGLLALDRR
jgi:multidrug transporter EmrE-like cation transporter